MNLVVEGTNRDFRHTVSSCATPAAIWRIWIDVRSWQRWDTELADAELEGPACLGAHGRLRATNGPWSRFTVFDPEQRDVVEAGLPIARLLIDRQLQATPAGVDFTHEVRFAGPLGWLFAALLGRRYRTALPLAMERLAAIAMERR